MFCTNCGNQIPDGAKFCTVCGAPVRAEAPVRAQQQTYQTQQQPVYQAAPQAVPVYAVPAAKAKQTTRWPVSTGIMGILHLFFYLIAQIPMVIYYEKMGSSLAIFTGTKIVYILLAFAVPVLFFVHTKRIAILTAIPMIVTMILEGISTFSNFRYMGSYDTLVSLLTFVPMFILTALYVIQMLARPHSAALPVIYLIFAIITIVLTFILNIRFFSNTSYDSYMMYIAIMILITWVADIFAYVAYIIAMFSSRKR